MIELTLHNLTKYKAFKRPFFKRIIDSTIKEVRLDRKQVGLSINIVSRAKICSLNKKYRNKDKATDILSFPLLESNFHKKNLPPYKNKNYSAIIELGDIFICPEVAEQKSKKADRTLKEEIAFLVVHGFLHLLGYDHEKSQAEEKKMFVLQNKILNKLN